MNGLMNVVPEELALSARQAFIDADYDTIIQERKGYYAREFNSVNPRFPGNDEVYTSIFCRAGYLEGSAIINQCYTDYIKPAIEQHIQREVESVDLRCYKMTAGGHFRIHQDSYIADTGFVWYLSKDWKWDWGGLLLTVDPNTLSADVEIPEFNKLVIMDHKSGQNPHSVTPVTSYAKEPRIMLVGFLKTI